MVKKNIFLFICLFFSCLVLGACGNKVDANAEKYATSIEISEDNISVCVDETINLDEYVKINPSKATVSYEVFCNNKNAQIDRHKVLFKSVGTYILEIKAKSNINEYIKQNFVVNVIEKPVYIKTISFEKENVVINMPDVITNKVTVLPNNYNMKLNVYYSNSNIVNYDISTGKITPISVGETNIYVSGKGENDTTVVAKCSVKVTNFIYATDFYIENVAENGTITISTNSSTKLNYKLEPLNCNMDIELISNNTNLINIVNGELVTNDLVGETEIIAKVKTAEDKYIERIIKVVVIKPTSNISLLVQYNNESVDYGFIDSNNNYKLIIENAENIDISKLKIESENINILRSEVDDDKLYYYFIFKNAGNTIINVSYDNQLYSDNLVINNEIDIDVYNKIESFNYQLLKNGNESNLESLNNLYLVEDTYKEQAILDNFAIFNVLQLNLDNNIKENNYIIYSTNNEIIRFENNKIIGVSEGTAQIVIKSLDEDAIEEYIDFKVEKIYPQSIECEDEINLYVNATGTLIENYKIDYSYWPNYAYNDIKYGIENTNIATIEDGVVKAKSQGYTYLNLESSNFTKRIKINCIYNITHFIVNDDVTGSEINNIDNFVGDVCKVLYVNAYSNNENLILNKNFEIILDENLERYKDNILVVNNTIQINFNCEMSGKIIIQSKLDSSIKHEINVSVLNKVLISEMFFENENVKINLATDDKIVLNKLNVFPEINNDKIVYESSNTDVAIVDEDGVVNIVGVGNCEIYAKATNITVKFNVEVYNEIKIETLQYEKNKITINLKDSVKDNNKLNIYPINHTEEIKYFSSNTNVALIDEASGELTILAEGETIITAESSSGKTASYSLIVVNYLEIKTYEDFTKLNNGGIYYLVNDINFGEYDISAPFNLNGRLMGNNHTIYNLKSTLFDEISKNASVENLNISCADGFASESNSILCNSNNGTIKGVNFEGSIVSENSNLNIICNDNFGTIENCVVNSNVKFLVENGTICFVNNNNGLISDCDITISSLNAVNVYGISCNIGSVANNNIVEIKNNEVNITIINSNIEKVFGIANTINKNLNNVVMDNNIVNIHFENDITTDDNSLQICGLCLSIYSTNLQLTNNIIKITSNNVLNENYRVYLFCRSVNVTNEFECDGNVVYSFQNFKISNSTIEGVIIV